MNEDMLLERQRDAYDRMMDTQQQEIVVFKTCDMCGNEIYEGDEYYDFDDEVICEDCLMDYVNEFKTIAE